MSDPSTPAQSTDPASIPVVTAEQGDPAELGDGGKKALAAERSRAAAAEREAKALKARLDELETANLSELDKTRKAAADATARLAEYEKRSMRQEAALAAGLAVEDVDRLRGDTPEELLADAKSLAERLSARTTATPKPDLSQGAKGTALALNGDPLEQALRDKLGI